MAYEQRGGKTAWVAWRSSPELKAEIEEARRAKGQTLADWSAMASRLALAAQRSEEPAEQAA